MSVVEAATMYHGGTLVGNDYKISLPDVVPISTEVNGVMGNVNVPLLGGLESMELGVTKVGIDKNAAAVCTPGKKDLSFKWVQNKIDAEGDVKPVGCKAEFRVLPKSYMPAADIEVGSATEFDCKYEVFIYKLFVDGTQILEVNKLTSTLKMWDGSQLKDYSQSYNSLL